MTDAATNEVDRGGRTSDRQQPERCSSDLSGSAFEPQR